MGFFSNLKNSITGGWADVQVTTTRAVRGAPMQVTVEVAVRSDDIKVKDVYVVLECHEIVEIDNYRSHDHDDAGDIDYTDIHEDVELFEQRVSLAREVALTAGSKQVYEGRVDLPDHLPPSYRGRNAEIRWQVLAALDMKGNDPDSGWQQLDVR